MDNFKIIAITSTLFFEGEAARIQQILENKEADFVHIRKPGSSSEQIEKLISEIDSSFYPKLKLHDYFTLAKKYNLGGVHINSRCGIEDNVSGAVSKSCHSIEELNSSAAFEYVFLSPIFDSLSKPGYKAKFDLQSLKEIVDGKNVIALGGVTPDKFDILKSTGFAGAAMLGYFFPSS